MRDVSLRFFFFLFISTIGIWISEAYIRYNKFFHLIILTPNFVFEKASLSLSLSKDIYYGINTSQVNNWLSRVKAIDSLFQGKGSHSTSFSDCYLGRGVHPTYQGYFHNVPISTYRFRGPRSPLFSSIRIQIPILILIPNVNSFEFEFQYLFEFRLIRIPIFNCNSDTQPCGPRVSS
jgi:hypothetical protein